MDSPKANASRRFWSSVATLTGIAAGLLGAGCSSGPTSPDLGGSGSGSYPAGGASGGASTSANGGATTTSKGGTASGATGGSTAAPTGGSSNAGSGGASAGGGSSGGAHSSGGANSGGAVSSGGANSGSGGSTTTAGNPDGSCKAGIPTRGQPASTATPTTVVGTGTPASCTYSKLSAAAALGGIITFDCGSSPTTILVTDTLKLPTNKNTVIDGGNKVTLDGGSAVQIMRFDSPDFQHNDYGLTLQHLSVVNGKTTPQVAIPTAPAPCSQGFNDGQGGALYMRDGNLTVIDSIFMNNQAAPLGPDTGGGAIYVLGSKRGVLIVGSTFSKNSASNAGAVGGLFAELDIYNSLFTANKAIGNGANNNEPSKCAVMNNDQNETGSGGNGGAIYSDGASVNVLLCGNQIVGNAAGAKAFGGGLFFTSNDFGGTLSISDTTMTGNTGGSWTQVSTGSVTNVGTGVGTNAKSISVSNSTLQGYP